MTDIKEWFSSTSKGRLTTEEIANRLGISRATATRRIADGLPSDDIIKLSRSLGINPVIALVELGYVTYDEAFDFVESDGTLVTTADDEDLVLELAERIVPAKRLAELRKRAEERIATVTELPLRPRGGEDVASPSYASMSNEERLDNLDSEPFAASTREPEPQEGDDGYSDGS
ncbi:HTH domain-containing protein [Corynebacterium sp. P6129]|uniref:HTH domain-containing protein n=1 Tax=Corynebacterium antarcticum TaxID=2800405 RepID=UPI002260D3BC|nr:HTH domain-containing protein [Corynebacterium antarcticum]MCX7491511.1 HTH domain-containing protein [Corynebacterium antarcticum]